MLNIRQIVSSEKLIYNIAKEDVMRQCKVVRTISKTTSYELFDLKTGNFVLGCTANNDLDGNFIFTTLRGTHEKDLKEIPICKYSSSFLGILKRNLLGLTFSLFNDNDDMISRVSFKTAWFNAPVVFSLSIFTEDYTNTTVYRAKDREGEIILQTKPPLWNSEINTYVHNFGCRVKRASNWNFIVVRSALHTNEATEVHNAVKDTATFDSANRICIRHGKVSESEYVLDFRDPVSPLVALATMCAAYSDKILVSIG